MKKLLLLFAAVGMIFTACEGSDGVEENNGGTPFVPEITISPKDLTFGCNGGEQAVDITANFEYEVAERASWVTVEQTDEGLLVIVDANKNTSERSAFISITNSQYDINKSIEVYQEGYIPKIELAQQSVEVEVEPAEYEVAVTSPYSWEATSKNDWIIVDTPNGIAGTKMLKFSVVRNEEEDIRESTIVVKNEDYNLVAELYVIQKTFVPAITIEPETLTFAVEGGTQEVAITANFEYEFLTNADWLTIEKSESGAKITAVTHIGTTERIAYITISNEKYGISKTIAVAQKSNPIKSKNVILYRSSDGQIVTPYKSDVFGANIVSNTYGNGYGIITFDSDVMQIGDDAFRDCTSLTSITIPDSVTSIGERAFMVCSSLKSVSISNSVTSIGKGSFFMCGSMKSVIIPNSITDIGTGAFAFCASLTSITIPDSVTSIGDSTFGECSALKAFYGKFASADNRCLIINGVLNAFAPAGLTEYSIPDNVSVIGHGAFHHSYIVLECITIGKSVTLIGDFAFENCNSLKEVYCKSTTPPTGSASMFNKNASGRKIYVPTASVEAYKAAQYWSDYADYIVGYDF